MNKTLLFVCFVCMFEIVLFLLFCCRQTDILCVVNDVDNLETFTVNNAWARFIVLLLRYPHLLKG